MQLINLPLFYRMSDDFIEHTPIASESKASESNGPLTGWLGVAL